MLLNPLWELTASTLPAFQDFTLRNASAKDMTLVAPLVERGARFR
jgi:hypothetical protein